MVQQASSLFPTYARFPITLVKGEGSRLWDDQGKEYIDLMAGLAVTNLGHAPEVVKEKLVAQLDQLWHVSNLFHIPNQEKLAKLLTDNSCADAVFFCSTGAEANEAAIKLARRYSQKVLGENRYEIITFHQSFHGRTLATLTATGQEKVQEGFHPLPEGFVYADYNDLASVEKLISERTCAVMLEMVQAEGGVIPADPAFVKALAELCKERGLLLIVDEIQTGMGRTGKLFAYEHYGIEPDIFTLAKGLGSGFPIGAMLGNAKVAPAFSAGSHGSTFGGTPIATAAAIATVEYMLSEKIPQRAAELGEWTVKTLREKLAGNPIVEEVRGEGLLIGIVCKQPAAELIAEIHEAGVLVVSAGPQVVRLLPSLVIPKEDLQKGLDVVCDVLARKASALVQ
ncbi:MULTISPECIES: acetylornithine transaminase [Paenibacillus]|uniref:acetylornithine transaminase n=1 Tax=Paenibacillus TaxID=44249 RepID=UPI00020D6C65|nr:MULTISPECIES: acetylornithine transaminase [Paenibacillus]EGL13615.1 aminotransferase, acetylornithine/succinylornithine family [Paenibacillus sp. HGF7]EPD86265.1 acetylornithine/succinylornithine family transaminase [Paenibacillus sp. HGH0039]MBV6716765.1 acetylornithine transaminase [Paenibacillus chitinolyticus]